MTTPVVVIQTINQQLKFNQRKGRAEVDAARKELEGLVKPKYEGDADAYKRAKAEYAERRAALEERLRLGEEHLSPKTMMKIIFVLVNAVRMVIQPT